MVAKAEHAAENSIASSEVSLYRSVLRLKTEHDLEDLGIAFFDGETTIQWSYNGDQYFHAASTMKLAVLLGVMREVERGDLTLDAPVHISNRLVDIVGINNIQQALDELEIDGVKILRGVEDQAAYQAGLNNEVTANGLLKLLRIIADRKAYSPEASEEM